MLTSSYLPVLVLLLFATANLVVAYGDILNRTMCFCGDDKRNWDPLNNKHPKSHRDTIPAPEENVEVPSVPSAKHSKHSKRSKTKNHTPLQASWVHLDYYNNHLNRTFTVERECRSNWKFKKGNVDHFEYHSGRKNCLAYGQWDHKYCKTFKAMPNEITLRKRKPNHHFCYHFKVDWKTNTNGLMDLDTYTFDGHRRSVPQEGAIIQQLKDVVRAVCEPACKGRFNLTMMEGHWYHRSRVDTIWDQADMCRYCA